MRWDYPFRLRNTRFFCGICGGARPHHKQHTNCEDCVRWAQKCFKRLDPWKRAGMTGAFRVVYNAFGIKLVRA